MSATLVFPLFLPLPASVTSSKYPSAVQGCSPEKPSLSPSPVILWCIPVQKLDPSQVGIALSLGLRVRFVNVNNPPAAYLSQSTPIRRLHPFSLQTSARLGWSVPLALNRSDRPPILGWSVTPISPHFSPRIVCSPISFWIFVIRSDIAANSFPLHPFQVHPIPRGSVLGWCRQKVFSEGGLHWAKYMRTPSFFWI